MLKKPLVSVIIIFLNGEEFLGEAVASVLRQTYPEWELLLVDDGSTDGSSEMAQAFAQADPVRITYLEHPGHENRGMSAARNLGIRHSKGEYLAFLDADDVWLPRKLERQVSIMDAEPEAVLVYGKSHFWFSWTGHPGDSEKDFVQDHWISGDTLVQPPLLLAWHLSGKAAIPSPASLLVRRDVTIRVGGFEEEFRSLYEDQVFYAKVLVEHAAFVSDECLDKYRQHLDSACATTARSPDRWIARLRFLEWLADYLRSRGVSDQLLWQALRRQLWLTRPSATNHRLFQVLDYRRRVRKWRIRIEDMLLPSSIRRWLWSRRESHL
jgi:glycosyltransferase involved in cell wall biosynthesis